MMYSRFFLRYSITAILLLGAQGALANVCAGTTWNLTAGQYNDVGSLTVSNDADFLYITYELDYDPNGDGVVDATFGTLHADVVSDESLIDINGGRPTPGKLDYQAGGNSINQLDSATRHTFQIPVNEIISVDVLPYCEQALIVLAHAEVNYSIDDSDYCLANPGIKGCNAGDEDTAWGGDNSHGIGSGGGSWYYDGGYNWQCCDGPKPPEFCYVETAFAKGDHIFSTFRKSNPEGLESLMLSKNRWGWAINMNEPGSYVGNLYSGAGLNKIENGDLVGTFSVEWDGETATATYQLDSGFYLEEVHVYVGDTAPTTGAPGQYGYPSDGYDAGGVQSLTTTVAVEDTDSDGIWLIGHAVVSNGGCD